MNHLLLLNRLKVESANTVAGLTYGFPAITHFLGFAHALSRRVQAEHGVTLGGVAVVVHNSQIHARANSYGDTSFALTRNPVALREQRKLLEKTGHVKVPAIVEEGRMNLTLSLLIECEGAPAGDPEAMEALAKLLSQTALRQRLAGGRIVSLRHAELLSRPEGDANNDALRKLRRKLLPGFMLMDRSHYLPNHVEQRRQSEPDTELLDAWLDFAALKYRAVMPDNKTTDVKVSENQSQIDKAPDGETDAQWEYQPKPEPGYLVPLMVGYKAISEVYPGGTVANTRDRTTPFAFAESVYGIGEWLSPSRLSDINDAIWRYHHEAPLYLCHTGQSDDDQLSADMISF